MCKSSDKKTENKLNVPCSKSNIRLLVHTCTCMVVCICIIMSIFFDCGHCSVLQVISIYILETSILTKNPTDNTAIKVKESTDKLGYLLVVCVYCEQYCWLLWEI